MSKNRSKNHWLQSFVITQQYVLISLLCLALSTHMFLPPSGSLHAGPEGDPVRGQVQGAGHAAPLRQVPRAPHAGGPALPAPAAAVQPPRRARAAPHDAEAATRLLDAHPKQFKHTDNCDWIPTFEEFDT